MRFPYPTAHPKLADFFNERVARRLLSGNITRGTVRIATLFGLTQGNGGDLNAVLRGVAAALKENPQNSVLPALRVPLDDLRKQRPKDLLVLEILGADEGRARRGGAARNRRR